jgi:hypothetical protein
MLDQSDEETCTDQVGSIMVTRSFSELGTCFGVKESSSNNGALLRTSRCGQG